MYVIVTAQGSEYVNSLIQDIEDHCQNSVIISNTNTTVVVRIISEVCFDYINNISSVVSVVETVDENIINA